MAQENQWNKLSQGKNLGKIWPNYPQGKQIHYKRIEAFTKDLTLNLLLPHLVTYWHDYVQTSNPQTLSLLGFTATQATLLVTLRSHSKVLDHQ